MRANFVMKDFDVRVERIAVYGMDSLHQAFQIQLDSTPLAERRARRAAGRSFDTPGAHLLSDLVEVFLKTWFYVHR
jgi:hypothetical protein